MDVSTFQNAAANASALLRALAHEGRLLILCQLADGEKSVGAIAEATGLRQAAVSQQLGLLRRAGMVTGRRDGQTIYYALTHPAARRVIDLMYELFCADARHD